MRTDINLEKHGKRSHILGIFSIMLMLATLGILLKYF